MGSWALMAVQRRREIWKGERESSLWKWRSRQQTSSPSPWPESSSWSRGSNRCWSRLSSHPHPRSSCSRPPTRPQPIIGILIIILSLFILTVIIRTLILILSPTVTLEERLRGIETAAKALSHHLHLATTEGRLQARLSSLEVELADGDERTSGARGLDFGELSANLEGDKAVGQRATVNRHAEGIVDVVVQNSLLRPVREAISLGEEKEERKGIKRRRESDLEEELQDACGSLEREFEEPFVVDREWPQDR